MKKAAQSGNIAAMRGLPEPHRINSESRVEEKRERYADRQAVQKI